jgi:dihydroorotate dehydrogenase electron transfer subunit
MKENQAKVIGNQSVAQDTYLMSLECDLPSSIPGQFVMVKINSTFDPFLRRPLAILHHSSNTMELLYKIRGTGTFELSRKENGDTLSVLGPLGNGFSIPERGDTIIYIAGGTGLPPILALAERIRRGYLIVGARTRADIPLWERMESISGIDVLATTEDGSFGRKGVATDALAELSTQAPQPCIIYACGPAGMLRIVSELARRIQVRCEVSLEEHMACGFGVCFACSVKTTDGSKRVCVQGPVFEADLIKWGS